MATNLEKKKALIEKIEAVPTDVREKLKLPRMKLNSSPHPTHAVFGTDLEGNVYSHNLAAGPHYVVCGQTGSGKSVYMNSLLFSIFFQATPDEVQVVWIDPKKVEAAAYVDLPYCPINPVTDMGDAYGLMAYYTWLMDKRFEDIAAVDAKNLDEYNDWVINNPDEALKREMVYHPYVIIVIDEYADMVMQEKSVEDHIVRIGQKARAAGIHMLLATQRPSADVISPLIKANIPSRIGLKVADAVNSGIVIDEPGLEKLKGWGDSIVKDGISGEMVRVQGPYVSNDEIAEVFAYLRKEYGEPEFIDYKQIIVDEGLAEWADEYDDDTPWEEKHVRKKKMGFGRR